MKPQTAALALHHPHPANGAVQAFRTFGTVTHHGSGEVLFWAVVAILVLIAVASRRRSSRT